MATRVHRSKPLAYGRGLPRGRPMGGGRVGAEVRGDWLESEVVGMGKDGREKVKPGFARQMSRQIRP